MLPLCKKFFFSVLTVPLWCHEGKRDWLLMIAKAMDTQTP